VDVSGIKRPVCVSRGQKAVTPSQTAFYWDFFAKKPSQKPSRAVTEPSQIGDVAQLIRLRCASGCALLPPSSCRAGLRRGKSAWQTGAVSKNTKVYDKVSAAGG